MNVKLLTEHNLEFLSLKGGCTCLSESTLVKMPHCWISHVAAPVLGVCEQQWRRLISASVNYHILTCYKQIFNFLASLCSSGDWFESCFVGNHKDRFCRDAAHVRSIYIQSAPSPNGAAL